MHVETFEPRCLMTNTGLDIAFGNGGTLTLERNLRAKNVLAVGGAVYVDTYSASEKARYLFKYSNRGKLDADWGRKGRVSLNVFDDAAKSDSALAFDRSTGSVYVAGTALYVGRRELDVQRITASGQTDSGFSAARVNLSGGAGTTGHIVTLLPQADNTLLIGAEVKESFAGPGKSTNGTEYVRLIRLSSDGTLDRTYNKKGFVSVFAGNFDTSGTGIRDVPTLTDLTASADGVHVVGFRNKYDYRYRGPETPMQAGTDFWYAKVETVRPDGTLIAADSRQHMLSHRPVANAFPGAIRFYGPLTARLGSNGDELEILSGYRAGFDAAVTKLSEQTINSDLTGGSGGIDVPPDGPTTLLTAFGRQQTTYVRTGNIVTRLQGPSHVVADWGRAGRISVDSTVSLLGVDDGFRLMARSDNGRAIYRFNGA